MLKVRLLGVAENATQGGDCQLDAGVQIAVIQNAVVGVDVARGYTEDDGRRALPVRV